MKYPLWRRRRHLLTLRVVFGVMMSVCVCVDVCMSVCVCVLFRVERGRVDAKRLAKARGRGMAAASKARDQLSLFPFSYDETPNTNIQVRDKICNAERGRIIITLCAHAEQYYATDPLQILLNSISSPLQKDFSFFAIYIQMVTHSPARSN